MKKLTETDQILSLKNRLSKIGVEIELGGNYPWVYLEKINGKKVKEKRHSDHYFTIGFLGIKKQSKPYLSEQNEVFKLIRKYLYY